MAFTHGGGEPFVFLDLRQNVEETETYTSGMISATSSAARRS